MKSRKSDKTIAIENELKNGGQAPAIAKRHGVTMQTVYNIKYNMKKGGKKPSDTNRTAQQERTIKRLQEDIKNMADDRISLLHRFNSLLKEIGDQAAIINYLERKVEALLAQQLNNLPKGV